ncbi:hypothetical protein BDV59DRAFT_210518 [Aspergillus ambiguus]|uniref:uncharacterized protein n=1 Tax=Aspergillus ambiguus TaxID=176160 RepID=UPI003CCD54FC
MSSIPRSYRRKRSRVACEPCREQKRKCNGDIPCYTCTNWGYDCHYNSKRRAYYASSRSDGTSSGTQIGPSRIHSPSHARDFTGSLEANSGAAFMELLANIYFNKVDPCYGFIDSTVFFKNLHIRWRFSSTNDTYDSILAGVAALGLLFSERHIKMTETCLVELARSIMDSPLRREPPSLDLATAWALRVVYLRMTAPPHQAWIASSTLMHMIEAAKLHQEPSRLVGVSRYLNLWISYDLGLSRVSFPNDSFVLPSSRPDTRDFTIELLNLLHVSTTLSPEIENNDKDLERALVMTLSGTHTRPPSILGQCNLVLCLLRRLRMTNITASSEIMKQILILFGRALDSARTLFEECCPWHHVANVPFQMITVLLEMDTSPALALLPDALQTLKLIASTYDTDTMQDAYSTACLLITLYQRRRSDDTRLLGDLLNEHNQDPALLSHQQPILLDPGDMSWLEGLVADVPTLQGVDLYDFLQADMASLSHGSEIV